MQAVLAIPFVVLSASLVPERRCHSAYAIRYRGADRVIRITCDRVVTFVECRYVPKF
jgi:hypothetical protein